MNKIHMRDFADYVYFDGAHHCFEDLNLFCYVSGLVSIYVPCNKVNAAAIISLIKKVSEYFAIYPLSLSTIRHNMLRDVSMKANVMPRQYKFGMLPPPKVEVY